MRFAHLTLRYFEPSNGIKPACLAHPQMILDAITTLEPQPQAQTLTVKELDMAGLYLGGAYAPATDRTFSLRAFNSTMAREILGGALTREVNNPFKGFDGLSSH